MVERFFPGPDCAASAAEVFRSVAELEAAITDYIRTHNQSPKPFIWTAYAQDIMAKVARAQGAMKKSLNSRPTTLAVH